MEVNIHYEKPKVIQALRYHFITRPEIKTMIIVVNIFAIITLILYSFKKITPLASLTGSVLWIILMISFWFILPSMVYARNTTFKNNFTMKFTDEGFTLSHLNGSKSWPWKALATYKESPHFFHLYFDSRSFFLIPKNGIPEPDGVFNLRKMLNEKTGKK